MTQEAWLWLKHQPKSAFVDVYRMDAWAGAAAPALHCCFIRLRMKQPKNSECSSTTGPSKLQSKSLQMPNRPIAKRRALWRRLSRSAWIALVFLKWPHSLLPLSLPAGIFGARKASAEYGSEHRLNVTPPRSAPRNLNFRS